MAKPTLLSVLQRKVSRDRFVSRGFAGRASEADERAVDPDGGNGYGIIRGASLIAKGEALGHGFWIDDEALDQVAEFAAAQENGIKVRFTHPSMSGDGLGSYLGRAINFKREGDQVFGDVVFSKTSRTNPEGGDRGAYVLALAEDDPEAFGMSIVFDHDFDAESEFVSVNESEESRFASPDSENASNFPHVRLSALHGADFVDTPAANPNGLFHTGPTAEILSQADGLLAYAFGISDEIPEDAGGLSPDRIRGYLSRFLDARGLALTVTKKEEPMAEQTAEALSTAEAVTEETKTETLATPAPEVAPAAPVAKTVDMGQLAKYVEKFGADSGTKYLIDGVSFEDALSAEFDLLKTKRALGVGDDRGEDAPAETYSEKPKNGARKPKSVAGFQTQVRIAGKSYPDADQN